MNKLLSRGLQFQNGGDLGRAIERYRAATTLDPRHDGALCLLGNALRLAARSDEAVTTLRDAVAAAPDSAEAHLLLAAALPLRAGVGDQSC